MTDLTSTLRRSLRAVPAGLLLGATCGFLLSLVYAGMVLCLAPALLLSDPPPLSELLAGIPGYLLMLAVVGGLFGILPASIVGALTGSIVAASLSLFARPPSTPTSILVAYVVASLIAVAINVGFLIYTSPYFDPIVHLLLVGIPTLIFLFAVFPCSVRLRKILFPRSFRPLVEESHLPAA